MLQIYNIQRVEFGYQLRSPTKSLMLGKEIASYCACNKHIDHDERLCEYKPFVKGDPIVKVRVRVLTREKDGEKQIWYRSERWQIKCFLNWMEVHYDSWVRKTPYAPRMGGRPRKHEIKPKVERISLQKRLGLDDRQMKIRRHHQTMLNSLNSRLTEYKLNPNSRRERAVPILTQKIRECEMHLAYWNKELNDESE
jgi:hypothetical protein